MQMNFRVSLRTILLVRHQPRENPKEPIYLPLNHSFPPFIRLPEHLFRSLLNRPTMTQVSIKNVELRWLGDPPCTMTFREQIQDDVLYAAMLFGLCHTSHSTHGKEPGSLWATIRGGPSGWECRDYSRQCAVDHVLHWPSLERHFVVQNHAHDERFGGHVAKWMFHIKFTKSVHTGVLVLKNLAHIHRTLVRASGYHDFLEEEEERMKQTQAPVCADAQESAVCTHAEGPNGSSTSTTAVEDVHQHATEISAHRCLRLGFLLHRLACCSTVAPSTHQVPVFPLSIPAIIQWDCPRTLAIRLCIVSHQFSCTPRHCTGAI